MATNGYERAYCHGCLFYKDLKHQKICTLYYDDARADKLQPLCFSDGNPKFFEECKHFVRIEDLKNIFRKNFGIKVYDYGW